MIVLSKRKRKRNLSWVALVPVMGMVLVEAGRFSSEAQKQTSVSGSDEKESSSWHIDNQDHMQRGGKSSRRRRRRGGFSRLGFGLDSLPLGSNGTGGGEQEEESSLSWHAPLAASLPNVTQKVTAILRQHWQSLRYNLTSTTLLSDATVALSLVTAAQAVQTAVANRRGLVRQSLSTAIAQPTQLAWKHIADVVETLQAEPTLRAWTKYRPHVVWQALQAIRKLQRALPARPNLTNNVKEPTKDSSEYEDITKKLAYYSVYATLSYGWPMALARMAQGQARWRGGGSLQSLLQQTGLNESNILQAAWQAETRRPAFLLIQDPHQKAIVLTIRGTWSASDLLTDLCCTTTQVSLSAASANNTISSLWQWLVPHRPTLVEAHNGMVQAALALQESLHDTVANAVRQYPDHRLVLVGHSMGGGAAALLGLWWQNVFNQPVVYVYGPPCVAPFESPLTDHAQIHSVVLSGDPFCNLSLGHVMELAATVGYFAKHDALRRRICRRHVSSRYAAEIWSHLEETVWSKRWLLQHQEDLDCESSSPPPTKLVPPGKVWCLVPKETKRKKLWQLQRVSTKKFLELSMQPFAMDLTRHAPTLYEACLQQALNNGGIVV